MKAFSIAIGSGAQKHEYQFYIGEPSPLRHPLHYQDLWWRQEYDVVLPDEVMESFETIYGIAYENNVNFEDLAVHALGDKAVRTKQEGNVVYADFSRAAAMREQAEATGPLLSADPAVPDVLFFDCFRVEGANVRTLCRLLTFDIVPDNAPWHLGSLAEELLCTVFFTLAVSGDHSKKTWMERLDGFLGDDASYNLAVIADVLGYQYGVSDLGILEFFLCCAPEAQDDVCAFVRQAISDWAGKPTRSKTLTELEKVGVKKKDLEALKKTLKTTHHSL